MRPIVQMRFGAHLYGTDTPHSDLDLKGVFVPAADDILLQRAPAISVQTRDKVRGEKNMPGDIDCEAYSVQRYLDLLAEGQTVALDMLFAPDSAMTIEPDPLWREIQANSPRLVSRRASAFLRYCRQQADKYGIKGSRIAAARKAHEMLIEAMSRHGAAARLAEIASAVESLARDDHILIVEQTAPNGALVRLLEICGRRVPFHASLKTACELAARLIDEYGERARQAERNEGVDWKALSHAVRVGHESLELLRTGRITLHLPNAEHVREVKAGALPYATVAAEIEGLLTEVERAAASSVLRDEPDRDWIDSFVLRAHRDAVRGR